VVIQAQQISSINLLFGQQFKPFKQFKRLFFGRYVILKRWEVNDYKISLRLISRLNWLQHLQQWCRCTISNVAEVVSFANKFAIFLFGVLKCCASNNLYQIRLLPLGLPPTQSICDVDHGQLIHFRPLRISSFYFLRVEGRFQLHSYFA